MRLLALSLALAWLTASPCLSAPRLGLQPCKIGDETVECGRLAVPEDWRRPTGRQIDLKIVVLPKIGQGPEQAPMVWLDGGPGIAGTNSAGLYTGDLRFHRQRRAVILFDQRGTGESGALHCPKIERQSPLHDLWSPADVVACRRALEAHVDLSQYGTDAAVRDLDAVREALGYDKVDLAALSYGTMLAQAYLKRHPEHVRAAALFGSVPLGEKLPLHHAANGELALRRLFADCRSDPACHAAFPHLETDWLRLEQRLAKGPVILPTPEGALTLRSGPFNELVRNELNTPQSARSLPLLISRAARGDFAPLIQLVQGQGPELVAEGLYLSVTCPEGALRIAPAEIGAATRGSSSFGRYRIDQQIKACRLWTQARPDPALLSPVSANTPVLFLAGGHDATAPPFWARQIAARLPNSRVVVIEPMTHLPVGLENMDCPDRIMDAFFERGSAEGLDTSCVATMRPPPFAVR